MSTTTWVSRADLHKSFREVTRALEEKYVLIDGLLTKDLYPLQKDSYHFLTQILRSGSREEHALLSHILNMAYRAEIHSQGAGSLVLGLVIGFTKHIYRHELLRDVSFMKTLNTSLLDNVENLRKTLENLGVPGTKEYLDQGIETICNGDHVLAETARQAIYLAGLEGKLFVENGKQPNYLIEHVAGYIFKCKPYKLFLNPTSLTWSANQCRVLVVDGFIENVSEIDGLLQKCHETKQPMVIISTGFSEEVVATLKINQEKGNFECIPVRIMPDLDSLNMVNDVAVVCGTLPVSNLKGELLTFVKHEELPIVEHIELRLTDIAIRNTSSARAVSDQVKSLLEKRNENFAIEDVQNIIDGRLRSLVASSVVVHLSDSSRFAIDERRVHLDNCFRYAKTVINHGVVDARQLLKQVESTCSSDFDKASLEALREALKGKEWQPTLSLLVSYQVVLSGLCTILSSGGMVKLT